VLRHDSRFVLGEEHGEVVGAGAPVGIFSFGGVQEESEVGDCIEGGWEGWVDSKVFCV